MTVDPYMTKYSLRSPEVAVIPPQFGRSETHSDTAQTEAANFVRESQHILNPCFIRT